MQTTFKKFYMEKHNINDDAITESFASKTPESQLAKSIISIIKAKAKEANVDPKSVIRIIYSKIIN